MFLSSCVRCFVATSILMLLLVSQIDVCAARSLGLQDEYWPSDVAANKRNSWWSKKSLEADPEYQRLLKESSQHEMTMDDPDSFGEEFTRDSVSILYGCYITTCVPKFVRCAQLSRSPSSLHTSRTSQTFSQCRQKHQRCAMGCRLSSTDKTYVV